MSLKVSLSGFKELDAALAELSESVGKGVLNRTLKKAAQPMADLAKSMAPVADGHLRDSIIVSKKLASGNVGAAAFGAVMRGGGSREDAVSAARDANRGKSSAEIYMGPGQHPQAIFQEFGTINHAPQPFMRPAFDQDAMPFIDRVKEQLATEIDKSVARARAKALRG